LISLYAANAAAELHKKVNDRKQTSRQHLCHKKMACRAAAGVFEPVEIFPSSSLITTQNLVAVWAHVQGLIKFGG